MLLDTCFLIDAMRGDEGAKRHLDATAGRTANQVPAVAVHELHRGLARSGWPPDEHARIRAALDGLAVLAMDDEAARLAGQVEGSLKEHGQRIDVEDCMIAGIALRHGLAVVTRNARHFERIQGLDVVTY